MTWRDNLKALSPTMACIWTSQQSEWMTAAASGRKALHLHVALGPPLCGVGQTLLLPPPEAPQRIRLIASDHGSWLQHQLRRHWGVELLGPCFQSQFFLAAFQPRLMPPHSLQAASSAAALKSQAAAVQAELHLANVRLTNVHHFLVYNGFAVTVHRDDVAAFAAATEASASVKGIHRVVS